LASLWFVVLIAFLKVGEAGSWPTELVGGITAILIGLSLILPLWIHIQLSRRRREAAAVHGRLCMCCGFDMSSHQNDDTCPECGLVYNELLTRKTWRRAVYSSHKIDWGDLDQRLDAEEEAIETDAAQDDS